MPNLSITTALTEAGLDPLTFTLVGVDPEPFACFPTVPLVNMIRLGLALKSGGQINSGDDLAKAQAGVVMIEAQLDFVRTVIIPADRDRFMALYEDGKISSGMIGDLGAALQEAYAARPTGGPSGS